MVQKTSSVAYQHFTGTGSDSVEFGRSATALLLNTSGGVSVSFDGGTNYMLFANGTIHIKEINVKTLFFQGGAWSGIGIAL